MKYKNSRNIFRETDDLINSRRLISKDDDVVIETGVVHRAGEDKTITEDVKE